MLTNIADFGVTAKLIKVALNDEIKQDSDIQKANIEILAFDKFVYNGICSENPTEIKGTKILQPKESTTYVAGA